MKGLTVSKRLAIILASIFLVAVVAGAGVTRQVISASPCVAPHFLSNTDWTRLSALTEDYIDAHLAADLKVPKGSGQEIVWGADAVKVHTASSFVAQIEVGVGMQDPFFGAVILSQKHVYIVKASRSCTGDHWKIDSVTEVTPAAPSKGKSS